MKCEQVGSEGSADGGVFFFFIIFFKETGSDSGMKAAGRTPSGCSTAGGQ